MRCREIKGKLVDYLDDEVELRVRKEMDEHFASCTDCRREMRSLRMVQEELADLPREAAPEGFLSAVQDRIAGDSRHRRLRQRLFQPLHWKLPLELAGVFASALLIVFSYHALQQSSTETSTMPADKAAPASALPTAPAPLRSKPAHRVLSAVSEEREEAPLPANAVQPVDLVLRLRDMAAAAPAGVAPAKRKEPSAIGYAERETKAEAERTAPLTQDRSQPEASRQRGREQPVRSQTLEQVQALVLRHGGRILSRAAEATDEPGTFIVCALPAAGFAPFRTDLGQLGTIEGPLHIARAEESATIRIRLRILPGF